MMASACINNAVISTENFIDCPPSAVYPSHGWLSPRVSFSRDFADEGGKIGDEKLDRKGSVKDFVDFEFRLDDPVAMLPADELFSNGQLVPLHLAPVRPPEVAAAEIRSPVTIRSVRKAEISGSELCAVSPKAPRCSSRWKELLGLKKVQQSPDSEPQKAAPANSKVSYTKSLKHFLHGRNPKSSSADSSLSLPLLRDSDSESVSISARASLSSSSSSGADHEDLPRLSLDLDKFSPIPISVCRNPTGTRPAKPRALAIRRPLESSVDGWLGRRPIRRSPELSSKGHPAVRVGRCHIRCAADPGDQPPPRGSSVDSPRLNASGKVIFQGLERSSSSPSTFNGGPRPTRWGMERSFSANVRVLNVPVCTLRGSTKPGSVFGFGQLFSPQKKEKEGFFTAKIAASSTNGVTRTKCERSTPGINYVTLFSKEKE